MAGLRDTIDGASAPHSQRAFVVNVAQMPFDMQAKACELATEALDRHPDRTPSIERDVAQHLYNPFDAAYAPAWHCVWTLVRRRGDV